MASTHQQKTVKKKMEDFGEWLKGMGHNPCNLRLHSFPPDSATPGFATIAGPGGIRKGQTIVQVRIQAFMSEYTAQACPHVGPIIRCSGMTAWQGLCLHLLVERAKGIESSWHPYLALLPTELQMVELHPLMWPLGMCQKWLAGSPMLSRMEQRFSQCKEDYEIIRTACKKGEFPGIDSVVTEVSIRWAASILLSRAFSLDLDMQDQDMWNNDSHTTVLVPWADMLNHSSSAGKESCLTYDPSHQLARLRAHKSYEEGEQVFDSYGPNLSPSQLLLDYGFVDHDNKNHAVDLPAAYLGPTRNILNKALLTAIRLLPDDTIFSLTESGVDDSVLAWTRAAVASTKELADAGWREETLLDEGVSHKAASAMAHFIQPVGQENESEVWGRLVSACGNVLTQYPTSLDVDLTSLDATNTMVPSFSWAQIQAQRAVISEKRALEEAWKHLYALSKKLPKRVKEKRRR